MKSFNHKVKVKMNCLRRLKMNSNHLSERRPGIGHSGIGGATSAVGHIGGIGASAASSASTASSIAGLNLLGQPWPHYVYVHPYTGSYHPYPYYITHSYYGGLPYYPFW